MKKNIYLPIKITEVQYEFIISISKILQVNKSEALRRLIDKSLNDKQFLENLKANKQNTNEILLYLKNASNIKQ